MKDIKKLVNDSLTRYSYIHDFNERSDVEKLITALAPHYGETIPYLYQYMNGDRDYDRWCTTGGMEINKNVNIFIHNNCELLIELFETFKDLPIKEEGRYTSYVDEEEFFKIIYDFLEAVNPELVALLKSIQEKGNLIRLENYRTGEEIYDKKNDDIYLLVDRCNTVETMISLMHELGHAYPDYLYKEYHETYNPKKVLKIESPSSILELLFIKYLIDNDLYQMEAQNYLTYYNNNIIKGATSLIEILNNNNSEDKFKRTFNYCYGQLLAYHVILNNIPYKEIVTYIHENNIETIIQEIDIDVLRIHDEINKNKNKEKIKRSIT